MTDTSMATTGPAAAGVPGYPMLQVTLADPLPVPMARKLRQLVAERAPWTSVTVASPASSLAARSGQRFND